MSVALKSFYHQTRQADGAQRAVCGMDKTGQKKRAENTASRPACTESAIVLRHAGLICSYRFEYMLGMLHHCHKM
jgi:hypothetical protein